MLCSINNDMLCGVCITIEESAIAKGIRRIVGVTGAAALTAQSAARELEADLQQLLTLRSQQQQGGHTVESELCALETGVAKLR